jgi:hypothetical protein
MSVVMRSQLSIVVSLLILGCSIFGQSSTDPEKRYGSGKYYEIRPSILMKSSFTTAGQLCSAEFIPSSVPRGNDGFSEPIRTVYFHGDSERTLPSVALNVSELLQAMDELVPEGSRKGVGRSSIDISGFGSSYTVSYRVENVDFLLTVLKTERRPIDLKAVSGDLKHAFNPPVGVPVSAAIFWTDRKCTSSKY